jgi:hypothetical protein
MERRFDVVVELEPDPCYEKKMCNPVTSFFHLDSLQILE